MSNKQELLDAIELAALVEREYARGRATRGDFTRALNHVAVCRDRAQCSFLRVVHLEA